MSGYLPAEDSAALAFMQVFANGISANPALYQLTSADAASISAAVAQFATALAITSDPAQRTKVTVSNKDDARTSAEQIVRQYAIEIKFNAGITEGDKIAIGVRPPNSERDPIPAPSTEPILNITDTAVRSHTLRFADITTPDKKARPFGAANLQVFVAIGDEPTNDPSQAKFLGAATRNPIGVIFTAEDDNKTASYFARWANAKGEVGPWSAPVSMSIAA